RSARIVRGGKVGMTDSDYPSISILSTSSLDALGAMAGAPLASGRFRGNLWIDGLAPWAETEWVGKTLVIGDVRFDIRERIERCRATEANPDTGQRDENVLAHLEAAGQEAFFGLHAVAANSGTIKVGDRVTLAA
ncbi:MAG: MOSC domain-containing protein, partial [Alphaproteobacteria bacterium]|nr:MOSC domain-containing protein [Alphaproteobacteria bacterium]